MMYNFHFRQTIIENYSIIIIFIIYLNFGINDDYFLHKFFIIVVIYIDSDTY